jgi:hypothetical protein
MSFVGTNAPTSGVKITLPLNCATAMLGAAISIATTLPLKTVRVVDMLASPLQMVFARRSSMAFDRVQAVIDLPEVRRQNTESGSGERCRALALRHAYDGASHQSGIL